MKYFLLAWAIIIVMVVCVVQTAQAAEWVAFCWQDFFEKPRTSCRDRNTMGVQALGFSDNGYQVAELVSVNNSVAVLRLKFPSPLERNGIWYCDENHEFTIPEEYLDEYTERVPTHRSLPTNNGGKLDTCWVDSKNRSSGSVASPPAVVQTPVTEDQTDQTDESFDGSDEVDQATDGYHQLQQDYSSRPSAFQFQAVPDGFTPVTRQFVLGHANRNKLDTGALDQFVEEYKNSNRELVFEGVCTVDINPHASYEEQHEGGLAEFRGSLVTEYLIRHGVYAGDIYMRSLVDQPDGDRYVALRLVKPTAMLPARIIYDLEPGAPMQYQIEEVNGDRVYTIHAPKKKVSFFVIPREGIAPLEAQFHLEEDLPPGATVLWDFGDGTSSEELEPLHRYRDVGTYTPILKVTTPNSEGVPFKSVITRKDYIKVRKAEAGSKEGLLIFAEGFGGSTSFSAQWGGGAGLAYIWDLKNVDLRLLGAGLVAGEHAYWSLWNNQSMVGYAIDAEFAFQINDVPVWFGPSFFAGAFDMNAQNEWRSSYWSGGLMFSYQPFQWLEVGIKGDLGQRRIGHSLNHDYIAHDSDYGGRLFIRIYQWWKPWKVR